MSNADEHNYSIRDKIRMQVIEIIQNNTRDTEKTTVTITDEIGIIDDLGCDKMEMIVALKTVFSVEILNEEAEKLITVNDVVECIVVKQTTEQVIKIIQNNTRDTKKKALARFSETKISEDLGFDSLDSMEMIMAFEEAFDIEISDQEVEDLITVGDIVDYILKKQK